MSTDTDRFAGELRERLSIDHLHSHLDFDTLLSSSRRARRRHAMTASAVVAGSVAVVALAIAVAVPQLKGSSPEIAPAEPSDTVTARVATAGADAVGVSAATSVTGGGAPWMTALTLTSANGTEAIGLVPGSTSDLAEVTAETGALVDHALRVVVGDPQSPSASFVIAWAEDAQPGSTAPHVHDPSQVTLYSSVADSTGSEFPRASRLLAGVVPSSMPDARVVFFSAEPLTRLDGPASHAVEIPTFADPGGSGARVYLAVATPDVPAGVRPRGIFFVNPDGTFVDAEGTCADNPKACSAERADGLDLKAELTRAIQP